MPSIKELRKLLRKLEDDQFVTDMNAGARRYKASTPLLISGVILLLVSAGLAEKSDLLGASVAAVGILLILAGSVARGD